MVTALGVRQKMQHKLAEYALFQDDRLQSVTLLKTQGFCNENYLVVAKQKKYIARKFLRTDIDRKFEYEVQGLAYKEGITAEPLIYDETNGFMLFEFVEGEHRTLLNKDDLKDLAHTLQKLHNIKLDTKPVDIHLENETDDIIKAFETIEKYKKEYVLCHNDLNPQNLLWSKDVKFIDWEYAGMNDRYFDLACVCVEFGLEDEMREIFLNAYFDGVSFVKEKIEAYIVVYKILCEEWFSSSI